MNKDVIYAGIMSILINYDVDIEMDDLIEIINSRTCLYSYAWIGDKILDMVLAMNAKEIFGRMLDNEQLHKLSRILCNNKHLAFQIHKLGIMEYDFISDIKQAETFFEALIYLIYKNGREEAVFNFLNKIDFFTEEEIHIELLRIDDSVFVEYIEAATKDINYLLAKLDFKNSANIFFEIYSTYKRVITTIYSKYYSKNFELIDFKDILAKVIGTLNSSNIFKAKNLYLITEIAEIIENLNESINKNETRVYIYIEPDRVEKYANKYIIAMLNKLKTLS